MPRFSIIIPLFNRPQEIDELLDSLTDQTYGDFEVIVIEDGSSIRAEEICSGYLDKLDIKYFYKENEGPGLTRNYGCQKATSDFFIFFDSDCIIPKTYLEDLSESFKGRKFDAFGGPDAADDSFTTIQKAINYSMTSIFTTGGIRGKKNSIGKFHPRSFNMGISRKVFEETGGFAAMRFGEDIDFSLRILKAGFSTVLITDCSVFHKRRANFIQFYKQVYNSGIARINLFKLHPESLRFVHFFPSAFSIAFLLSIIGSIWLWSIIPFIPFIMYFTAIFLESLVRNKNLEVAFISIKASIIQLVGYGFGFIKGFWERVILGKDEFHAFQKTFYK